MVRTHWLRRAILGVFVCVLAASANADTIQMAEYMVNPTFDNTDISATGGQSPDLYYQVMPTVDAADGWNGAMGGCYYIQTKDHINQEDTCLISFGGEERLFSDVSAPLVHGTTYQVQFKYRSFTMPTEVFGKLDLQVAMGFYDGSLLYGSGVLASSTDEWQTYVYSFTYNENDHAAGRWAIVFTGTNPDLSMGAQGRVLIDSLSAVPEPTTLAVLSLGGLFFMRKRK